MRKIKKIFNVALVAATTTIATTIPLICSCKFQDTPDPIEPSIESINIELPLNDFFVQQYRTIISDPILVTCFDQQGKSMEAETIPIIQSAEGAEKPEWVWIDNRNQINISANIAPSDYTFNIYFVDKETQTVKSETKSFTVQVYDVPTVPPESLEITHEHDIEDMIISDERRILLKTVGHHEGYQPSEVDASCKWTRGVIMGPHSTDYSGNPLFTINYNNDGCELILSRSIDSAYRGLYTVVVNAVSILNPRVSANISVKIQLVDGRTYTDTTSGCVFRRKSFTQPWTLSQYIYDEKNIGNMPDFIYGYPVTKVASNFCSASGLIDLQSITLSNTISEIGDSAFENQDKLEWIIMPGAKYIGNYAFANCVNMNISYATSVSTERFVYLGNRAFYNCQKLDLNGRSQDFVYIGQEAFAKSGIIDVNLGEYINFIDTDAFSDCSSIRNIIISNKVPPKVAGVLFYGSSNPQSIKVPKDALETYLNDPYWEVYSDIIVGM